MEKMYKKYFNDNRLDLSYNGLINQSELFKELGKESNINNENDLKLKNPLGELIQDFDSIKIILEKEGINPMLYLYLNRKNIHNILYAEDANIVITKDMMNNLTDYIYLYLLIKEVSELVNYKYDLDIITKARNMEITAKFKITKIILCKIIKALIKNNENEEEDDEVEEKCKEFEKHCNEEIKQHKGELKNYKVDLDLDKLEEDDDKTGIEVIYSDIIKTLILKDKLKLFIESDFLKELEIKDLRLTPIIFDGLLKAFNEKKIIDKYKIEKLEDLENEEKLIFYQVLFEYILKDSIYICYIPFLIDTRKKIIEIIHEEKNIEYLAEEFKKTKSDDIKLKKVLSYFIELDYLKKKFKQKREEIKLMSSQQNSKIQNSQSRENKYSSNSESQIIQDNSSYNQSSGNPFDGSSYQNRSGPSGGLSSYEQSGEIQMNLTNERAHQILTYSTFKITVQKNNNINNIIYDSISYKDKDGQIQKISIEEVKNLSSKEPNLNENYKKFIGYLDKVEKEFKDGYENDEEKMILTMRFTMQNAYYVNCLFTIEDDSINEREFTDENILNNNNHNGLYSTRNAMNGN